MLMGVPVIVSYRVGICREILADGSGVVVPFEVEAIARALADLLAHRQKLKTMGQRAVFGSPALWRRCGGPAYGPSLRGHSHR